MRYNSNFDSSVKNILVAGKNNQIGDMLCSLPFYISLKKRFPDAKIILIAAKTNYEIPFKDINPYLDEIIILDRSTIKSTIKFIKKLRRHKYQIGIVPSTITMSKTSHIINFFSGAQMRVGVKAIDDRKNKSAYLLNIKSEFNFDKGRMHQTDRILAVIKQIGCDLSDKEKNDVRIQVSEEGELFAKSFITCNFPDKQKLIIGIHPGAGKTENIWDINNFITLVKKLDRKFNPYFIITAGWTDDAIVAKLKALLNESKIDFTVAKNFPIKSLTSVLSRIDLYITNDTGVMHIAGMAGCSMISLFGPTKCYEWAPKGENQFYIQSNSEDINSITVEEVFFLCEKILSN